VNRAIELDPGPLLLVGHLTLDRDHGTGNDPKVSDWFISPRLPPTRGNRCLVERVGAGHSGRAQLRLNAGFLSITTEGISADFAPDLSTQKSNLGSHSGSDCGSRSRHTGDRTGLADKALVVHGRPAKIGCFPPALEATMGKRSTPKRLPCVRATSSCYRTGCLADVMHVSAGRTESAHEVAFSSVDNCRFYY